MQSLSRVLTVGVLTLLAVSSSQASATKYRWRKTSISIAVSTSVTSNSSNLAAGSDTLGAIDRSLASWMQVVPITLRRHSYSEQNVSPSSQGDGVNLLTIAATPENIALFPEGLKDATARTRIFYDARGFITEADIVLNPFLQFSTDGTVGTFDLESTVTHEVGHLLGLDHSPVIGATMSDSYGKNGVYNLPAFAARTLAADDIAAARSLYGGSPTEDDCCGRLSGRLSYSLGKPAASYEVWLEDTETARVSASAVTAADGSFRIGGIQTGRYRVFAQSSVDLTTSALDLGEVAVTARQAITLNRKLDRLNGSSRLDFLGLNGQLSGMAVPVNAGSAYLLLAGSLDFGSEPVAIGANSAWLNLHPRRSVGMFSNDIRTLGFEADVDGNAPLGEYSVSITAKSGFRRFLIGGITVEKFPNLWSIATFK